RRVGKGLLEGDVLELGAAATAERAARGREDDAAHLARRPGPHSLSDRGVLGVDGYELGGSLDRGLDERPARDEGLLVRGRARRARLARRAGRAQPGGAVD